MKWINFFNNLFKSDKQYYHSSFVFNRKSALYIDTSKPNHIYNTIANFKMVVDTKASMFSNMELLHINDETGEVLDSKELYELLKNPNPLQSMNQWLRHYKQQEQVYGNQFVYKNKPSDLTKYPLSLYNISPCEIEVLTTGKLYNQYKIEDIIYGYKHKPSGQLYNPEHIMYSRINDLDNPIIGVSVVHSLQKALSNIEGAYEYRNVIINEKGAIGVLQMTSKDAMGSMPLDPEIRKKVEDSYTKRYGIKDEQSKVILTDKEANWIPMTYPTKELMLFEEVDVNENLIIKALGLNSNMFGKNPTYENVKQGIIQAYQDTIIPEADLFTQALGKFLNIPKGTSLKASYDHVSILKENEYESANTLKTKIDSVIQLVNNGILDNASASQLFNSLTGYNIEFMKKKL